MYGAVQSRASGARHTLALDATLRADITAAGDGK
jgi:hypothetical protein